LSYKIQIVCVNPVFFWDLRCLIRR